MWNVECELCSRQYDTLNHLVKTEVCQTQGAAVARVCSHHGDEDLFIDAGEVHCDIARHSVHFQCGDAPSLWRPTRQPTIKGVIETAQWCVMWRGENTLLNPRSTIEFIAPCAITTSARASFFI